MMDFLKKTAEAGVRGVDLMRVGFVAVDSELTGLDGKRDSIVSVGAVRIHGGRISLGDGFYRLVNPESKLTASSVVIHEITPEEVSGKPLIAEVLHDFLEYCGDDCLVGFCIAIDMEFLTREARRFLGRKIDNPVVDIQPLFEWMKQRRSFRSRAAGFTLQKYSLYDLAGLFEIPVSSSHNAMVDAYVTAQIFQRMLPVLNEAGIRSVGDLMTLLRRLKGGDGLRIYGSACNF